MIDWRTRKVVKLHKWLEDLLIKAQEDPDFQALVKERRGATHDITVIHLLRWIKANVKYKSDSEVYQNPEVWQEPSVTLKKRTGDCEDGAILLLILARMAGVPAHAIQLACGLVDDPSTGNKVGHAYVIYVPQYDGVPRVLDWCYYPDMEHIQYRTYWSDETKYDDPWFMVNDQRYYGRYYNE